jgi:hypothetical protein
LQPKGFLRISTKSDRDLLRASFDEKMLEKHPKAIYLNKSEVGHVPLRVVHVSHDVLGVMNFSSTILKPWTRINRETGIDLLDFRRYH